MLTVITAALAMVGCVALGLLGRSRDREPAFPAISADDAEIRPALVNLVLGKCRPDTAAYDSTILDLAARGFLAIGSQPGGVWLAYSEPGPAAAGLAGYEQCVLDDMHGRLKNTGGAPFAVLAAACRADVEGIWSPFEYRLRTEARRRGLCHRHLGLEARIAAVAVGTTAAAAAFACLLVLSRPHTGLAGPVMAAGFTAIGFPIILAAIGRRERLTPLGTRVAAWSSFTGTWRLVKIKKMPRLSLRRAVSRLGFATLIGFIVYMIGLQGSAGLWPLAGAAVAILIAASGITELARISATPRLASFDGQVIARWRDPDDSDTGTRGLPHCAVDDGQRAWTLDGWAADQVTLEDLVRVTVRPRSGKLIELTVTRRLRPVSSAEITREVTQVPAARPAEPLLTSVEVESLIGPVTRTTPIPSPGGHGTIYRGSDGSLSLVVTGGHLAALSAKISNRAGRPMPGRPMPGIGEEAWMLNRDRTVVWRVDDQIAKMTVTGSGPAGRPDLLTALATTVAGRMAARGPMDPTPLLA